MKRYPHLDQIDLNDAAFVAERTKRPILACIPAPEQYDEKGQLEKINPHVSRFYLGPKLVLKKGFRPAVEHEYMDVVHVKPVYYRHIDGGWRPMSEVASKFGNTYVELKEDWEQKMEGAFLIWLIKRQALFKNGKVLIPSPSWIRPKVPLALSSKPGHATVNFLTLTAYPEPQPATTAMDAPLWYDSGSGSSGKTWANLRGTDANNANASVQYGDDALTSNVWAGCHAESSSNGTNRWYKWVRNMFLFDTSALTSGATISAATFSFKTKSSAKNTSGNYWTSMVLGSATPASNTNVATTDWQSFGTTSFGSVAKAGFAADTYQDISLNASGLAAISKTGVSKFGLCTDSDFNNTEPTYETSKYDLWTSYYADYTGTGSDPKIVITYTTSTTYNQTVEATTTLTASMLTPKTMIAALTASTAVSASIANVNNFVRELAATATATASVLKGLAMEISASATITASVLAQRAYLVAMNAAVAVSASTQTAIGKLLEATANVSATLTKTFSVSQLLEATSTISASIEAGREKVLEAAVAVSSTIQTAIGKTLTANVSIIAKVFAPFWRTKYPAHGDGDDYDVKYPHD